MNWKKIKEYDYIVSKQGEVKRLPLQSNVKIFKDKNGYEFIYGKMIRKKFFMSID